MPIAQAHHPVSCNQLSFVAVMGQASFSAKEFVLFSVTSYGVKLWRNKSWKMKDRAGTLLPIKIKAFSHHRFTEFQGPNLSVTHRFQIRAATFMKIRLWLLHTFIASMPILFCCLQTGFCQSVLEVWKCSSIKSQGLSRTKMNEEEFQALWTRWKKLWNSRVFETRTASTRTLIDNNGRFPIYTKCI